MPFRSGIKTLGVAELRLLRQFAEDFRVFGGNPQDCAGGAGGLAAALFLLLQGSGGDSQEPREACLRQARARADLGRRWQCHLGFTGRFPFAHFRHGLEQFGAKIAFGFPFGDASL